MSSWAVLEKPSFLLNRHNFNNKRVPQDIQEVIMI